jgi:hypothetical protein
MGKEERHFEAKENGKNAPNAIVVRSFDRFRNGGKRGSKGCGER